MNVGAKEEVRRAAREVITLSERVDRTHEDTGIAPVVGGSVVLSHHRNAIFIPQTEIQSILGKVPLIGSRLISAQLELVLVCGRVFHPTTPDRIGKGSDRVLQQSRPDETIDGSTHRVAVEPRIGEVIVGGKPTVLVLRGI